MSEGFDSWVNDVGFGDGSDSGEDELEEEEVEREVVSLERNRKRGGRKATNLLLLSEKVMDLEVANLGKHRALKERKRKEIETVSFQTRRDCSRIRRGRKRERTCMMVPPS